MTKFLVSYLFLLFSLCISESKADIIWNVTYSDVANNTGVGFNDPMQGAARRSTFQSVLNYVSSTLNENGTVNFTVNSSQMDGSGFLASAGSSYNVAVGFQRGLFQRAILGENFGFSVGSATFDFGFNWNSNLSAPNGNQFDLFSVSLHEVTHALGFASLIGPTGASEFGNGTSGTFSNYDQFLRLSNGNQLFTGGTFTATADLNSNSVADALESNQVVFVGQNAIAANGGTPVAVYSPFIFSEGSSISHITNPSSVMQFSIASGVSRREYNTVDLGILRDLGYTNIVAVPEPSSILVVGMATASAMLLRMRSRRGKTR